jgi:hypothetical protein
MKRAQGKGFERFAGSAGFIACPVAGSFLLVSVVITVLPSAADASGGTKST